MKIAYDLIRMRPGCPLLQAALGGTPQIAERFPPESWLLVPTEAMRVYPITEDQLRGLVKVTAARHEE